MPLLSPVKKNERIQIMDALRGFAILGIFIANLGSGFVFYNPDAENTGPYFSSFDQDMMFLHHFLIEGKFYSIFSFLFGWGIALQLQRSAAKNLHPVAFVSRRLLIMFLLGLCHIIFLWPGDIVAFYSLVAFLLLLMRNWNEKNLLIMAIILILSPVLFYFIKMQWQWAAAPAEFLRDAGRYSDEVLASIYSEEQYLNYIKDISYWKMVKLNIGGIFFRFSDLFFQSRISKVLGMFIIGYLVGRNFRFKQVLANTRLLWIIAVSGLLIGLPANYFFSQLHDYGAYYGLTMKGLNRTIAYALGVAPLTLSYIALFFLLSKTRPGEKLLSPLRPVGKMAFTNYILQSVIGIFVFQSFGFNLMGRVGPVYFTLFAAIVFVLQIFFSMAWLRFFQYGPIEWLWRSATYGKRQRFRNEKEHVLLVNGQ